MQHLAKTIPQRFVAKSGGSNRVGRIFVDYLRNGHGADHGGGVLGARAAGPRRLDAGAPGSSSGARRAARNGRIATAREYLSFQTADPWAGYWKAQADARAPA